LTIHFITSFLSLHRKSTSISRKIQNPKFPQYMSLQKNNKLGKGYSLHQSKAHYGSFKQKRRKTKSIKLGKKSINPFLIINFPNYKTKQKHKNLNPKSKKIKN